MDELQVGLGRLRRLAALAYVMIALVVVSSTVLLLLVIDYLVGGSGLWFTSIAGLSLLEHAVYADFTLVVSSYVVVGCWIYHAHANLRDREVDGLQFSPGWAVGWFAIPIANLFKPFQAMNELWQVSLQTGRTSAPSILYTWWAGYLLSGLLGFTFTEDFTWFDVAAYGFTIVSAACLFVIIRDVTRAQQTEPLAEVFG